MDTSKVILDEARPKLTAHLAARFKQKIGQNVISGIYAQTHALNYEESFP